MKRRIETNVYGNIIESLSTLFNMGIAMFVLIATFLIFFFVISLFIETFFYITFGILFLLMIFILIEVFRGLKI